MDEIFLNYNYTVPCTYLDNLHKYFDVTDNGVFFWRRTSSFILSITAAIFNIAVLVLLHFAKLNPLKKNYYLFVRSLLLGHCLVAFSGIADPFIVSIQNCANVEILRWAVMLFHMCLFLSVIIIYTGVLLLCIDQYVAVVKPLRYGVILSTKKCRIIVISVWAISFTFVFINKTLASYVDVEIFFFVLCCSVVLAQLLTFIPVCVLYALIIVEIRKQLRFTQDESEKLNFWHKHRAVVTFTWIFASFILFMILPFSFIFWFWGKIITTGSSDNDATLVTEVSIPFVFLNCISDPIIYLIRLKEIRNAIKRK